MAERQVAERALLLSEQRYRSLLASTTDYVYTVTLDRGRAVSTAHGPGCEAVTGFTSQEFDADTSLWYRMIHAEDRPAVLAQVDRIMNGEGPRPFEHRLRHKDGQTRWIRNVPIPQRDPQGRVVSYSGLISDITERKESDEKQRSSEARLQAILDHSTAVIYLKHIQGRYLLVNRRFEALFNRNRQEVVDKTDSDLFPQELADAFRANDQKVIAGLAALEFEEAVPQEDGPHTYLSVKFPLLDAAGAAYAVCGISTDISERKRAEEQLRRAYAELALKEATLGRTLHELEAAHEELKATELQLIQAAKLECIGTLAAGVAHEVRNPLQTMLMGLHYLAHNLPAANEGITLALEDMRNAVTRANAILRGLLELSAETKSETRPEDLNACVERALGLLHYELVATHTTVVRQLAVALPLVPVNRGKLEQALINIFFNALQAMSQGGTLTVTTRAVQWSEELARQERLLRQFTPGATLAVIEVQDTGTGIPEHLLPKVFDPFFTTKPAGQGTGLGLAVVKKIVDLHGGAINIRNAPPGGVRVTLILKLQ